MKSQSSKFKVQTKTNLRFGVLVLGCALSFGCLGFVPVAHAARLYFDPAQTSVALGSEFNISLKLDPEGEDINAVEATLTLPNDSVTFRGVPVDNSIISLWVERPHVQDSLLKLTGIIPGGFKGILIPGSEDLGAGNVATFELFAKKVGAGVVHIQSAKAIKNDGTGNAVSISTGDVRIEIKEAVGTASTSTPTSASAQDTSAPEPFSPIVIKSRYIHNGAWVAVFNTRDTGSGIDHYEISEGGQRFERVESPYLLKDQSRTATIEVKAIDYAGNERVETIPAELPAKYSSIAIAALSLAIAVLLTWAIRRILTHKRRRRP